MKKYGVVATKAYRKDYKRLMRSGFDVQELERVIDHLASGEPLPSQYRDHALTGIMKGQRECHIGPDWLLRYEKDHHNLVLVLIRTGDHRRVLGIE
jgi:mRNA interferase YafQ